MRPTIFLFDIDGTIISSGGAGRRAVERAFARLHARADACTGFSFAGMTDRAIARAGLGVALGRPATELEIDELLAIYLEGLAAEVATATQYSVCEGIVAAIEAAARVAGSALGLGTGNLEAGARVKLSRVGLADRFAFGGYGSDHEDRAELLRIGADRGAARLGEHRAMCRVVVIGDTPRDVSAAKAIGAESIAVATGPFSVEELAASEPTWRFASLAAPGALAALVDGI